MARPSGLQSERSPTLRNERHLPAAQRLGSAAAQRACGGISPVIPQSVPTGECLALRHFLPLTSVAATAQSACAARTRCPSKRAEPDQFGLRPLKISVNLTARRCRRLLGCDRAGLRFDLFDGRHGWLQRHGPFLEFYPQVLPFLLVHAGCVAAIWSGVSWQAIAICVVLYALRMFAIGAGYHRYFSHRAF
jgi:hypothetical protein